LKICYVLSYRAPNYIRTRSILRALRETDGIEVFEAINQSANLSRYYETFRKTREIKEKFDPDVYLLGFRGHEFYWPLRHLVGKKPVILDALMSPYASLRNERKHGTLGVIGATGWRLIEQGILNDANFLLTDTLAHVQFYEQEFALPRHKLLSLPVGADERETGPRSVTHESVTHPNQQMTVLFYGSFLPLHGIDVILDAASRLRDQPIRFDFIGGDSRQVRNLVAACAKLGVTRYTHREWVEFDELINEVIPNADICLGGPFGNTDQARRVITGKTSQCLALGKPTIIGEIDENHGFANKKNCLLIPQGNPEALAEVLRWAYENRDQLELIGEHGRSIYAEKLSIKVIRERLGKIIFDLVQNK
jgi:glycosyltransferase involved in cell wall biosynthesis